MNQKKINIVAVTKSNQVLTSLDFKIESHEDQQDLVPQKQWDLLYESAFDAIDSSSMEVLDDLRA
jgi:type IV secretory pathway component VirB8